MNSLYVQDPVAGDTEEMQDGGGIVDVYGNRMTEKQRLQIIEVVSGLPAAEKKAEFLEKVRDNPIVIVSGETGSGKTTQLPKYLHIEDPRKRIVVTQPRVVSAMSNAHRVSQECLAEYGHPDFSVGKNIGYRTGRGKSSPKASPLSFNTDGLELMRQAVLGIVPDILILDEVHNYAIPTEVLAMTSRRTRSRAKLVIMSATLDPAVFQEYYRNISQDIPVIQIPGRTFPVDKDMDAQDIMMERVVSEYRSGKNILLFAPGKKEIDNQMQCIREQLGNSVQVFALHGEMPKEEQNALLKKDANDTRPRIIVATNVAEESITIDYIDVVIDTATSKVSRYTKQGIPGLFLEDISHANCLQRAGRSGRTHPGQYFRHNEEPSSDLPDYSEAPIEREMLDRYILILLSQGIHIEKLLELEKEKTLDHDQLFFHKVNPELFRISLQRLKLLGALTKDGNMTKMGHTLLSFPVDIYAARMLYEGIERGCSQDMAIIAAIYEKKGFLSKETVWKDLGITLSGESDLFAYAEIFKFVSSTTLTPSWINRLISLGINPDELRDFVDRGGDRKLYDVVDLSPLGIKKKRIEDIEGSLQSILSRFETLGIPLTTSTDSRAKRIAIASGLLHFQYTFSKELKGFVPLSHSTENDEPPSIFRSGNVSNVEGNDGAMYLGSPFIIGSEGDGGLKILTFVTSVDKGILREAKSKNIIHGLEKYMPPEARSKGSGSQSASPTGKSISGKSTSGKVSLPSDDKIPAPLRSGKASYRDGLSIDSDVLDTDGGEDIEYIALLEDFAKATFTSEDDSIEYYLRYCLPEFLMERNHSVKKYVATKLEAIEVEMTQEGHPHNEVTEKKTEWKIIFRELLVRFLTDEVHRIKPGNLDKTERSFLHDTGIIERFRESSDPYIRHFRLHGGLLVMNPPREKHKNDTIYTGDEDEKNTQVAELFVQKAEFARQIGIGKTLRMSIDQEAIQEFIIRQFLNSAHGMKIPFGAQFGAYSRISNAYLSVQKWDDERTKEVSIELKKNAGKYKREVLPLKIRIGYLEKLIGGLEQLQLGKKINEHQEKDIVRLANNHHAFMSLSDSERHAYVTTLKRVFAQDQKQKKRGMATLGKYISSAKLSLQEAQVILSTKSSQIDTDITPEIRELREGLELLSNTLFDYTYSQTRISPKISDTLRAIVRDRITEKKGLDAILFSFLHQGSAAEHIIGVKHSFMELVEHSDNMEVFEEYATTIRAAIDESNDIGYIAEQLGKLKKHMSRIKASHARASKNEIFLSEGLKNPRQHPKK